MLCTYSQRRAISSTRINPRIRPWCSLTSINEMIGALWCYLPRCRICWHRGRKSSWMSNLGMMVALRAIPLVQRWLTEVPPSCLASMAQDCPGGPSEAPRGTSAGWYGFMGICISRAVIGAGAVHCKSCQCQIFIKSLSSDIHRRKIIPLTPEPRESNANTSLVSLFRSLRINKDLLSPRLFLGIFPQGLVHSLLLLLLQLTAQLARRPALSGLRSCLCPKVR